MYWTYNNYVAGNILSKFSHYWVLGALCLLSGAVALVYVMIFVPPASNNKPNQAENHSNSSSPSTDTAKQQYPLHTVTATRFWIGEVADESNAFIPNHESAWVGDWVGEFGGIDDPETRCGYAPCGFVPKQNAFYVALPFNDIDVNGKAKSADILTKIPWYSGQPAPGVSLMKNRWVEIQYGKKTAYGQIEDVGPMYEDDSEYVFGVAAPKYKAGIDLSPALNDYLGTGGLAVVQWRFIEQADVPKGPWSDKITQSQINY